MSAVPLPLRMPSDTLRSTKGKKLYSDDNEYIYRVSHMVGADTKLRCVKAGCGAKATIGASGEALINANTTHTHAPSDYPLEVYGARKAVKFLRSQDVAPKAALTAVTAQLNPAVEPFLFSAAALKKGAQRLVPALTSSNYPYAPQTLLITRDGLPFMRYNSTNTSPDGCVVFYTSASVMLMNNNGNWSTDGTFRVAPPPYSQLFVIGVQAGHLFVPTVFALLKSKRVEAYQEIFDSVISMGVTNSPSVILMDFERAISTAAKRAFPTVDVKRCLFHLCQTIWRLVQSNGLVGDYKIPTVKTTIRCLAALAFLDPADVAVYYGSLAAYSAISTPQCQPVIDSFGRNYVGLDTTGNVHIPMYHLEEWTVRDRILRSFHASNSAQESFNASLKGIPAKCAVSHLEGALLEVANYWEDEQTKATQSNLYLWQYRKQGNKRRSDEENRRMALANGAMGQSNLDHLKSLSMYVKMD
ncbi:hypothetical protein PRIPAC_83917 [Pristionchus pacificus]|uniref:MULE domain-containing protein n=1 Tax=Pristionchus pacificus TaxID=54126 RepID=A0A2A6BTQ0_PRIPA|nr:hypothetical protein PRIPAC_83917 [Pristionchus pacificus]|eukprot:PDM69183.1 hypothetical protein PRIPAC_47485 [Pristionchus pacificus]